MAFAPPPACAIQSRYGSGMASCCISASRATISSSRSIAIACSSPLAASMSSSIWRRVKA
jgi:hypothetical protein